VWLGRVKKEHILDRNSWQLYCGKFSSGDVCWSHDDTIAVSVFPDPLHVAVQQVNWEPLLKRYIFANWAWLDSNGNSKSQLAYGGWSGAPTHMRSQMTMYEGTTPWGPFSYFY